MLNKLLFNNLVISNKTKIQQGRIQTVNKLVQKLRKLKSLLEKYPQIEKNKERLRKWTFAMEYVKKFKRLDLMRSILLLDKTPTAILSNGLSTPEEMAVAMLAMNKVVQDLAQKFKDELKLSAADQTWREEIMQTSKRRSKINRTEEKRKKRKEVKEQKAVGRKRTEWLSQNTNSFEEKDIGANAEMLNTTAGKWKVEELTEEETRSDNELKNVTVPSSQKQTIKPQGTSKQNKANNLKKPNHTKAGKPSKDKSIDTNKTTNSLTKAKKLDNKKKQESSPSVEQPPPELLETKVPMNAKLNAHKVPKAEINAEPQVPRSVEPKAPKLPKVTYVVDPFFITKTGENYLSTAIVLPKDETAEQKKTGDFYKPPNREFKTLQHPGKPYAEKGNHRYPRSSSNVEKEKLHPSWAAKQKLKSTISNFKGKKITFDDDGADTAAASKPPNAGKQQIAKPHTKAKDADNLHPSWVAKQKLKPTITAFQGKKITFGDDE